MEKASTIDIITNSDLDIWNTEELQHGYFQKGSIYLGAKQAIGPLLFEKNISSVLTVMDQKSYGKENIKAKMQQFGMTQNHMLIQTQDNKQAQLHKFYQPAFDFIQKQLNKGHNILVHCKGGKSRSPAILMSYLMKKHQLPFDKCYKLIKSRRQVVDINQGFQKELKKHEQQLLSKAK